MSYSDYDSDEDIVLPFNRLSLGEVILETCDLFAMRLFIRCQIKWCYHCQDHKDLELEEFNEDPCSACGKNMNVVSLREFWPEIEDKLSKSQLYDDVFKYLVGLGLKTYRNTKASLSRHEDRVALGRIIVKYVSDALDMEDKKFLTNLNDAE